MLRRCKSRLIALVLLDVSESPVINTGQENKLSDSVRLEYDGKMIDLPIVSGSQGERAIDIGKLRAQTGLITLDPGYVNTGACQSSITFIDGEKGILRYRGYPIEDLAGRSDFVEVSYLLINGELPSRGALQGFRKHLTYHTLLHEDVKRFYDGFPHDAHPMAVVSAVMSSLYTYYQDSSDPTDPTDVELATYRILSKFPTVVAFAHKKSLGQPFIYPDNSLGYVENFLKMMFSVPPEEYEIDPDVVKALDLLLVLHADHEQNCSTSTVRMVGSSQSNLFASISAGISALWGPLHGGANEKVLHMLGRIREDGGGVKKFVERVKNREERLMGFGHRVYKNFDPRARVIKECSDVVLDKLGKSDPLLDVARELELTALADDYFVERKLYPNVDFYSGILYRAIGIPLNMFTVMFAMGRMPGWLAQWKELREDPANRIGRPRQLYQGETRREYLTLESRD